MTIEIIILAAGAGTRMQSAKPKVLHTLAGTTLLEHVVNTASQLNPHAIHVVYGHGGELVPQTLSHLPVNWVEQKQQNGTGHAVQQALPQVDIAHSVLVLYGDGPLISRHTLTQLIEATPNDSLGLLTCHVPDPHGLGRIMRDQQGQARAIVEEVDATDEQRAIDEIWTGIMTCAAKNLNQWLQQVNNDNAQGEYYLADVPKLAIQDNAAIITTDAKCPIQIQGVNDKKQLATLERHYQRRQANQLLAKGVMVMDPERLDIRGQLETGNDVILDINVIIEGHVQLGNNTKVGANTVLRNVKVGDNVEIKENCVIEDSVIENNCTVGPFARLRPETHLQDNARVGNFVEVKKTTIGYGSKVNHLTYLGDTNVGKHVNVGAGTITCNYDGINKFKTDIKDYAFIGSNTELVAPVTIGYKATVGAGSTITKDIPDNQLAISRAKQTTISGWQRPEKKQEQK